MPNITNEAIASIRILLMHFNAQANLGDIDAVIPEIDGEGLWFEVATSGQGADVFSSCSKVADSFLFQLHGMMLAGAEMSHSTIRDALDGLVEDGEAVRDGNRVKVTGKHPVPDTSF